MTHRIEVIAYNPNWPALFEAEAKLLKQALGDNCIAIHHIGSTSVPNLSAKPIIDILPVVKNILEVDQATAAMQKLGYEVKGEYGIAFRRYFQKGGEVRTHNVHVYEEGDSEISRYLKFRDWMRSHPEDAQAYTRLKLELAAKFPTDILSYCGGKDAFVASIDLKDGFSGSRIVKALTEREWTAVQALRKNFLKSQSDQLAGTLEEQEQIHFVFYQNAEIVGYAHLQLGQEKRALLSMLVIDERYRKLGLGSQLLKLCERWLTHQGFKIVQVPTSLASCKFYGEQGYLPMPFHSFNGHEKEIGKLTRGKTLRTI